VNVSDVMTREVATVTPEAPLKEVALLMAERRISGVPVVDAFGQLLGVVSEADLLLKHRPNRPRSELGLLGWVFGDAPPPAELRKRGATTAAQAMTAPAVTTEPEASLREVASVMLDRRINRLPVVKDGRLVGIVSRADLVRAYLRADEESLRLAREHVLRDLMWLDPNEFKIQVSDGVLRISGVVDRRSDATIIRKLLGLVEGVERVVDELRWELDDEHLSPALDTERGPGAVSLVARDGPRPFG
jgi:CBS domain-containing protein